MTGGSGSGWGHYNVREGLLWKALSRKPHHVREGAIQTPGEQKRPRRGRDGNVPGTLKELGEARCRCRRREGLAGSEVGRAGRAIATGPGTLFSREGNSPEGSEQRRDIRLALSVYLHFLTMYFLKPHDDCLFLLHPQERNQRRVEFPLLLSEA